MYTDTAHHMEKQKQQAKNDGLQSFMRNATHTHTHTSFQHVSTQGGYLRAIPANTAPAVFLPACLPAHSHLFLSACGIVCCPTLCISF